MKMEQKLTKKINTIITITGEYPKEIEVTREEYNQLLQEEEIKENKFMGVKLKIKEARKK